MNTVTGLALYQPHRLAPGEFLERFVARAELAEFLLDKLRKVPPGGVAEHQLFVGQRGMGKTSLLRRLAIGVSQEADLTARYIPLTFREEQYNVRSLARLWRNCEESLAEWCESQGKDDIAADIDRRLSQPVWHDARAAADAFLATAMALGGRPILFIDNLDLILDALPNDEHWVLRQTLQAPGGPILYAAATQVIRQSGDRSGAFYEFFYPHLLQPLSEDELLRCLRKLADVRGPSGKVVHNILAREPQRLRTLHKLTGGNPRVLALVYQLLERAESDSVFSDLEVLLDQLTPFYKARVEEYRSDLQRAIIDAVALHWEPITSHDLAKATEVEITTISSQLVRFKNDGLIEEVSTSGARSGYQLAERFFNIWYLMRHGTRRTRQKMYWLTAFLRNFYAPDELKRMKFEAAAGETRPHPLYREALLAALDDSSLNSPDEIKIKSTSQVRGGSAEDEIAVCDDVVARFGTATEPPLRERVARALVDKGVALGTLGRSEDEIAVYDDVVARFEAASEPPLREAVARALGNKGVALRTLGRAGEAVAVYDDVVARFEAASEPPLREAVARALFNKGIALGTLGRSQHEIAVYDNVVTRFEAASEPPLREAVARALFNKGFALGTLGRADEEIAVYNDIVNRFEVASEPPLREEVAGALFNKGVALGTLGRAEEAIAVYDVVVARFEAASEPLLREQVARALVNKGVVLGMLGRAEEAITVCDDVVARFETATEPPLREEVAGALFNKGVALAALGRAEEATAVYDGIVARLASEPRLREQVAGALVNKGVALRTLGRAEEAIAVYGDVVARFEAASEPPLREAVAQALVNKGVALGTLGRAEEAIAVYDDVVARFEAASEPPLREAVAQALVNKGFALGTLGRSEDEIAVYNDVVARFEAASEPPLRERVAGALFNKGVALGILGRSEEALAAYRRASEMRPDDAQISIALGNLLADQFSNFEEAEAAYLVAMRDSSQELEAKADLGWLLVKSGRIADAKTLRSTLQALDAVELALFDAALEIGIDNLGAATKHLAVALDGNEQSLLTTHFDDVLRLLRLMKAHDYGEKLVDWLKETRYSERYAPVYAAFIAYVRGKRFLLDVSPEVRATAEQIYRQLAGHEPAEQPAHKRSTTSKRRRGRPPKR